MPDINSIIEKQKDQTFTLPVTVKNTPLDVFVTNLPHLSPLPIIRNDPNNPVSAVNVATFAVTQGWDHLCVTFPLPQGQELAVGKDPFPAQGQAGYELVTVFQRGEQLIAFFKRPHLKAKVPR